MNNSELLRQLNHIHRSVLRRFKFTPDQKRHGGEHWQMPASHYQADILIADDCDGFALACRKLLRDANIRNRLVYCLDASRQGHLVVEVQGWILDNMHQNVIANTLLPYKWKYISGYQAGEAWREIIWNDN